MDPLLRSDSADKTAPKSRSDGANKTALKQRSDSANKTALKQRSDGANKTALKQRSDGANKTALKQRSDSANKMLWGLMDPELIPIDDRGLLLGDGLFETVLFKAGRPMLWDEHVARLARGCAVIGLPAPDAGRLRAEADRALAERGLGEGRVAVRLTWTAGSGGRGLGRPEPPVPRLVVSAAASPRPQAPATVVVSSVRRNAQAPSARLKSLGYLDNVLARREAEAAGADEALLLDTAGHAACGAAANLFWISGGRLFTPSLDCGVLDGIVRAQVMAAAAVEEVRAELDVLHGAEAAFLSNSLIGLRPIAVLAGRPLSSHPIIGQLSAVLADLF